MHFCVVYTLAEFSLSVYLFRDPVNVPVTFALDLSTHGTAVAQRKQLLLLPLLEKTNLIYHTLNCGKHICVWKLGLHH